MWTSKLSETRFTTKYISYKDMRRTCIYDILLKQYRESPLGFTIFGHQIDNRFVVNITNLNTESFDGLTS